MSNVAAAKRAVLAQVKKMKLDGKGGEVLVIKSDDADFERLIPRVREALKKQLGNDSKVLIFGINNDADIFKVNIGR